MTWVKLDDSFFFNRKAVAVGADGRLMFLASMCYCSLQENNGVFDKAALQVIAAMAGVDVSVGDKLVAAELWHDRGERVEVHDYLRYNPTREQLVAQREAAKSRQQSLRASRRDFARSSGSPSTSRKETSPQSSSSDTQEARADSDEDDELINQAIELYADRKLAQAVDVQNPTNYRAKTVRNARLELTAIARDWLTRYDVGASQLADGLLAGCVPASWNTSRRPA